MYIYIYIIIYIYIYTYVCLVIRLFIHFYDIVSYYIILRLYLLLRKLVFPHVFFSRGAPFRRHRYFTCFAVVLFLIKIGWSPQEGHSYYSMAILRLSSDIILSDRLLLDRLVSDRLLSDRLYSDYYPTDYYST